MHNEQMNYIPDLGRHTLKFLGDEIAQEIEAYADLPIGWDFGRGIPASAKTVLQAKYVYLECKSLAIDVEPHPNEDGSISLIAFIEDHFLEIDITEQEFLKVRYARGKGDSYQVITPTQHVPLSGIHFKLLEMMSKCKIDTSSEPSILNNTVRNNKNSGETKFFLTEMAGFQFFAKIVQMNSAYPLANI